MTILNKMKAVKSVEIVLNNNYNQSNLYSYRALFVFSRFSISIGYYGLTFTLTSFPGNKYLNFFIAGAVEFVAYTLVIYITKR